MPLKTCSKCKIAQEDSHFPRASRNKDRADSWCKRCRASATRARRLASPEKDKERRDRFRRSAKAREWLVANRDRAREHKRNYASRNPDRVQASKQKYAALNRDELNAKSRERNRTDARRNYMNAYVRGRQAAQKQATPSWADRDKMRAIYAEARRLRSLGQSVEVDHIVPLKSDVVCGLHWEGNLRILSVAANRAKRNQLI